MMGVKSHNSCKNLFKRLEILSLPSEYIFSLISFITNTISTNQLLTSHDFRKAYYAGISIFYNLPSDFTSLMNGKTHFKAAQKQYLNAHSFYSVGEYFLSKN
jgi:FtsZ-interacting cell division protein ZipA